MAYLDATRNYRYSYSGSDARAYAYFEGRGDKIAQIESLHTISWSVHEAKGQVRALGYRGIKGFSRGVRTIAGSLITTIIEDNPLAGLMDVFGELINDPNIKLPAWSIDAYLNGVGTGVDSLDFIRRLAPMLPPINILVQYVAEGSTWVRDDNDPLITHIPGAAWLLRGIEFIDEGLVTSVNDPATEMTYSFMAMDCKTISIQDFETTFNPFVFVDDTLRKAQSLQQSIVGDRFRQEQQYKSQLNENIGPVFTPTQDISGRNTGVV